MRNSSVVLGRLPLHAFAEIDPETLSPSTPRGFSFKYIDISAVSEGKLTIPRTSTAFSEAPSRARRVLRAGDVIMSTVRPNLKAFAYCDLDEERYVASTGFAVLRAKESADPYFLLCAVLSNDVTKQIDSFAVGSNYPAINSSDVRRLLIPAHTLPEQKRIAEILSCIDTAIERTEALIAKHQQIKAGLMHDLFTRGVLPNGQLRPPRSEAPELYQKTAIGWIPLDWQIVRMHTLAEDRKGSTTIGPFGSDLIAADYRAEGVPVVFVRDVKESGFQWNSDTYVSEAKAWRLRAHKVSAGEVLATKMGLPPCISCVYPEWMPDGVITADMIRLTPDTKRVHPTWLAAAINHDRVMRQVAAITAGVTRPKVTLADFRAIRIALPELAEQLQASSKLSVVEKTIAVETERTRKLQKQKLGLMQDLLTGRVPVPAPEPEPMHA